MNPSAPSSKALVRLLLVTLLSLTCATALAQAASADYTADLPSVARIQSEIKGTDPTDTLARQVAVIEYLQTYIQRIKLNRDYRGPYTPGETRLLTEYAKAQYDLTQSFTKTHTPAEVTAFNHLEGNYSLNNALAWIKQLQGTQSAAAYKNAETQLAATQQAHYNQEMDQYKKDSAAQQAAATGLSSDPTAVATRRCLELGGDNLACVGKGFTSGLLGMITGGEGLDALTGPGLAGVVLIGNYTSTASLPTIAFNSNAASLNNCGRLAPDNLGYTVRKSAAATQLVLNNSPSPITLTMRSDGKLIGPGLVTVDGQVITGYEVVTHYVNGVASGTTRTPVYKPATDRCTVGTLNPPPPSKPAPASAPAQDGGLLGGLTSMMGTIAPADEPGLRIVGQYTGSSGLLLDFSGASVILDCGLAHIKAPYTIENAPTQFLVHVQNSGGPFTLAVASDNTLRGSGSTAVNGKLVTGMNGDNVTFAPRSETCNLGSFSPKAGTESSSTVAPSAAPAPTAATPITRASAAPTAPAPAVASSTNLTLTITSSFPVARNPLAGANVALMSERYDIALRKVGAPITADATPGKALQAYMANCGPPRSCPPLATAMHPYFVGKGTFDGNGSVTVTAPVPPGTYYVLCTAAGTKGALVWDVPVTLNATGNNTITLTATNAELIQ